MADIFIRALPRYAPDLIVLLGLYLLLLGRWKKQGRRRVLVYTVFSVYMLGVLWVTVLPVLSMLGIHHAYAPMVLEPFRDLRLGYGNAERQLLLNVLMTVPFGILWPVVRRGKAGVFRTVGAAFLLAAGLLCGACCSPLRLVGGAGAAAVSSLALLAPTAPWPLALTYKGTSAALCVAAAYGWQGARNTARLTAWFVLLNLTLTGALFLPGAACNNLSFYLPVSPGLLLASTAGVCGVVEGVLHVLGRSGLACFGAELSVAGRVVPLSVFCDTGFHVQEPLSGRAVVLVRLDAVSLPPGVRAYLDACLAGVGAEPRPEWGVRFVPCQTVAGHCLLPALPAVLASNGRKQDGIYAAFCDMPPPPGGWTALVSAETAALLGK